MAACGRSAQMARRHFASLARLREGDGSDRFFCMKWHENLYTGESVRKKYKKVKWKIMHHAGQLRVYVISLASGRDNLLDIIPSWELLQKHYPSRDLYVVGLAGSYDEALELAGHIVSDVYRKTGGFDVKGFIRQKGPAGI